MSLTPSRIPLLLIDAVGELRGFVCNGAGEYGAGAMVTLWDGREIGFAPGVDLDGLPERVVDIFGGGSGGDGSLSLTLPVQANTGDWWNRRKAIPIQAVTARLYWWRVGEVLSERDELFRGIFRSPTWALGPDGYGTVSLSLVPPVRSDDRKFPPGRVGDDGRFPDAPQDSIGTPLTVIYGTCLGVPLTPVSDVTLATTRMLIAAHPIGSTTVDLWRDGVVVAAGRAVFEGIDGLGGVYSYMNVTLAEYTAGATMYLRSCIGHMVAGRPVERLGDVMIHAFRAYGGSDWFELDRPRIEAATPWLNRFKVGVVVNDDGGGGSLLRFLESRLSGQFPVVFGAPNGRYGWDAVVLPDISELRPVASLTFNQDAHTRIGPTDTDAGAVLSRYACNYAVDGYAAGETVALTFDSQNSGSCRRAKSRWGESDVEQIDAPDCPDSATAYALLTNVSRLRSEVYTHVEYQAVSDRFFDLPFLSVILVTDEHLGWVNEPCILEGTRPRLDGRCDAVLLTLNGA